MYIWKQWTFHKLLLLTIFKKGPLSYKIENFLFHMVSLPKNDTVNLKLASSNYPN